MKMTYTLAALAILATGANAAITLEQTVAGANGNYTFQTFSLNDAGFSSTGSDALTSIFNLDSVTFTKGNSTTGSATTFLSVYQAGAFLGSSTSSIDWITLGTNTAATFDFTGVTAVDNLSSSTVYEFRFASAAGDGGAASSTRLSVGTNGVGGPLSTGNLNTDSNFDAVVTVNATAVPEPSSTALLGLGGLALLLRRRK